MPGTRTILDEADQVFVSPISGAELACLQERGRIELPVHWRRWLRDAIRRNGREILPVTLEIVEEAWCLPEPFHPDPADRILTATDRKENLLLMTADKKIIGYPHVTAGWQAGGVA